MWSRVYRIDLSRVVNKYIGETERNLGRVFDAAEQANVVLLFDEAEALFGKRSEVKDAHDRYANVEIGYLLQRMEAYPGTTILATNLRHHLDEASCGGSRWWSSRYPPRRTGCGCGGRRFRQRRRSRRTWTSRRSPARCGLAGLVGTGVRSVTDAEGRYRLERVPRGAFTLRVQASGFADQDEPVVVSDQPPPFTLHRP